MSTETIARASESSHWYDRNGNPVYEVPRADGKGMRNATLADARKMNLLPGVSSILACAAAPALIEWKVMQGILASLTLPRRPHEPDTEFIKRVVQDSQEQARKAAEKGTTIHIAIERSMEGKPFDKEYAVYVDAARSEIQKMFGAAEWRCETSFAHPLGFGGKRDLKAKGLLGDTKSKEFAVAPAKDNKVALAYDNHCQQLAAYDSDEQHTSVCFNLFISTSVPGLAHIHVWGVDDIARGWEQFRALHSYWCATKRYNPGWQA